MTSGSVLVVTEHGDVHAEAMRAVLRRDHGITPIQIDIRDFPQEFGSYRLSASRGSRTIFGSIELDDVRSVWWRRAHPCSIPPSIRSADDAFRQTECDGFIQGLTWSLPAIWVNNPGAERIASRKIVQLQAAAEAGFTVPETLITNDPSEAASFIESRPRDVIYKRTGTSRAAEFCETRLVTQRDLARLGSIRTAPTTFQDYIEAEADLRVVWIAGCEWSVRIDSQSGAGRVDSRIDSSVDFAPYELPSSVSRSLATLMDKLGLAFGVVDLRLGRDKEIYFLEVNPQGQFAYMEIKTGLPIFASLANLLVCGHGKVRV